MPNIATFKNVTATLAATAPVLAMVAGLATAHMIASATGVVTPDSATDDDPRRGLRTIALGAPDTLHPGMFSETERRGVRTTAHSGEAIVADAGSGNALFTDPARALSRQ